METILMLLRLEAWWNLAEFPRPSWITPCDLQNHYNDVIINAMASQITSVSTVCSIVASGADQRKHQSSASLAFVRGIHRWPVNSPHKGPVTRNFVSIWNVIMETFVESDNGLAPNRRQTIIWGNGGLVYSRWAIGGRWLQSPASQDGDGEKRVFM